MGIFFRSLGRELGKNTGKRISNALFGDKWSTPYRVGRTKDEKESRGRRLSRKERRALEEDDERVEIHHHYVEPIPEPPEMREYDLRREKREERLRNEYQGRVSSIIHAAIPKDEEQLVSFLRTLSVELSANTDTMTDLRERAMKKQLFGAACTKFSQAYAELESRYPYNPFLWDFYCTKIKLFFSRSPWKTLWKAYLAILILSTLSAIAGAWYEWFLAGPLIVMALVPFLIVLLARSLRLSRYRKYARRKR